MSINISKLKKEKSFENEKIRISFSIGSVSDSLSVYMKDEEGGQYHVLWEISPDRCNQNFDKTNKKIKVFVEGKIAEWLDEEEEAKRLREEGIREREREEEEEERIRKLMDSF